MILRCVKWGAIGLVGLGLFGGLLFGRDLVSYVGTSARSVRSAVKQAVPIEFELQRARNLLDQIIPEMHANVRLVAQEEVEVAGLKKDIERSRQELAEEKQRIQKLSALLTVQRTDYTLGGRQYAHRQVKQELARRFDRYKEAHVVLAGKVRLLEAREQSLAAAMQMLERTRSRKAMLEDQIEALEGKYRLIKAAAVGSKVQLDHSKLAQTEKLIAQIKKRLDVAERVLSHEAQFIQPIDVDTIDEKDLLTQINEYFASPSSEEPRAVSSDQAEEPPGEPLSLAERK